MPLSNRVIMCGNTAKLPGWQITERAIKGKNVSLQWQNSELFLVSVSQVVITFQWQISLSVTAHHEHWNPLFSAMMLLNATDDRLTMERYASHSVSRTWSVIGLLLWCWWDVVCHGFLMWAHADPSTTVAMGIRARFCGIYQAPIVLQSHSIQQVMIYRVSGCVILTVCSSFHPCIPKINL